MKVSDVFIREKKLVGIEKHQKLNQFFHGTLIVIFFPTKIEGRGPKTFLEIVMAHVLKSFF